MCTCRDVIVELKESDKYMYAYDEHARNAKPIAASGDKLHLLDEIDGSGKCRRCHRLL